VRHSIHGLYLPLHSTELGTIRCIAESLTSRGAILRKILAALIPPTVHIAETDIGLSLKRAAVVRGSTKTISKYFLVRRRSVNSRPGYTWARFSPGPVEKRGRGGYSCKDYGRDEMNTIGMI